MTTNHITEGAVLADGRYVLRSRLGSGGMASVWLARDERLGRTVAVKVMSDTLADDERYRARFAREARAAASVSHPSIVPVYDYGVEDGGRPFLVMEPVGGGTLVDALAGRDAEVPDPVAVAGQILSALECVHEAGLVHRDVKPANILMDSSGRARLTDFGIARPEDATALTQTGMIVGTLRYLAPEVIAGSPAGPAADLYAAGVVLRQLTERRPALTLAPLVAALTEPDPAHRPPSAHAALELLAAATAPGPSSRTAATARIAAAPTAPPDAGEPTAPTDLAPRTAPTSAAPSSAAGHGAPARDRTAPLRLAPRTALAAVVAGLLVLVIAAAALSGGDDTPPQPGGAPPSPAPADAPLDEQLRSLRRLVDHAAAR